MKFRYTKVLVQCERCERHALISPTSLMRNARCSCGGLVFIPEDGITLADAALNAHAVLLAIKQAHFKPTPDLAAMPDVVDQAISSLAYTIDRETGDDSPEGNGAIGSKGLP